MRDDGIKEHLAELNAEAIVEEGSVGDVTEEEFVGGTAAPNRARAHAAGTGIAETAEFEDEPEETEAPDDTEAAQETEPPAEPEEAPEGDDPLLAEAEQMGMESDFVQKLAKAGLLEDAIIQLDRNAISAEERQAGTEDTDAPKPRGDAIPSRGKRAPVEPTRPDTATSDFEVTLDAEQYDPELVQQFKDLGAHFQGRISELQAEVKTMRDRSAEQEVAATARTTEEYIQNLGDEWQGVFGKGAINELKANGPQETARVNLMAEAMALQARHDVPFERALERALYALHGREAVAAERRKIAGTLKAQRKQTAPKPTHRRGREMPEGERKALTTIRNYQKEHGGDDRAYDEDVLGGLL